MTWQLIFYMERGGTIIVELKKWIAVSRELVYYPPWTNSPRVWHLVSLVATRLSDLFMNCWMKCRLPLMFLIVMMNDVTFLNLPMSTRFPVKKEDFSHIGSASVFPVWGQRRITFISTPWYLALHPPIRKLLVKILIQRKHFTFFHLHLQDVHCWKNKNKKEVTVLN